MEPKCIVLDEPTAMLDPRGRADVVAIIEKLRREYGTTVVLITHHMDEAVDAHRVVVMNEGEIVMDGAPAAIFSRVEELHELGLCSPDTVELMYQLNRAGMDLPLTAVTVENCADAIAAALNKHPEE
jgi:energy-coupling factor transport system ATP-binding protein